MPAIVLIGAQWGDEGKGKATDLLGGRVQWVVRYQGGNNAGHTVVLPDGRELRAAPDPVGHPHARRHQRDRQRRRRRPRRAARRAGRPGGPRRRHLPAADLRRRAPDHAVPRGHRQGHRALPRQQEDRHHRPRHRAVLPGQGRPDRRPGRRRARPRRSCRQKVEAALELKNQILVKIYNRKALDADEVVETVLAQAEGFKHRIADTRLLLNKALEPGETVLLEGSQGTLLDVDHGTYPYVTSSNPTAGGAAVGSGHRADQDHHRARDPQGLHHPRRLRPVPDRAVRRDTASTCARPAARSA